MPVAEVDNNQLFGGTEITVVSPESSRWAYREIAWPEKPMRDCSSSTPDRAHP